MNDSAIKNAVNEVFFLRNPVTLSQNIAVLFFFIRIFHLFKNIIIFTQALISMLLSQLDLKHFSKTKSQNLCKPLVFHFQNRIKPKIFRIIRKILKIIRLFTEKSQHCDEFDSSRSRGKIYRNKMHLTQLWIGLSICINISIIADDFLTKSTRNFVQEGSYRCWCWSELNC